jgi:hypothetical protein
MNGEVPGAYSPEELAAIPGFGQAVLVCPSEGAVQERNWRRAGEFPDLLDAMQALHAARAKALQPEPAAQAAQAGVPLFAPKGPQDILDDASSRIFLHVADLMRELENRREERAVNQALQRQNGELRGELLAARERLCKLEERAALIPGFEDRETQLQNLLGRTRTELREAMARLEPAEQEVLRARADLAQERARASSAEEDAGRSKKLVAELSARLAEKELTLARAFGLIRKLEQTLSDIVPGATAGIRDEVPEIAVPELSSGAREARPGSASPTREDMPLHTRDEHGYSDAHLPPEGEVRPVPRPWRSAISKAFQRLLHP